MDQLNETQLRVLNLLCSVHDALVDDCVGNYGGPDAFLFAANQVDRELEQALLDLVRSKR